MLTAVCVAVQLGGVAEGAAPAAPASPATPPAPAVNPDALTIPQAVAAAKTSGKPVVVTGSTTASSMLTALPDGRMSLSQNLVPVRKRTGTKWAELDPTLRRNADGSITPAVTASSVKLSGGGDGPVASMDGGAASLELSLPMTLPAPQLAGDTATYAEILPGVDLQVRVTTLGGVSEVLVVKNAAAARNPALRQLRFATRASGMDLKVDADGGLSGRDSSGDVVLHAQPPKMWDSTFTPGAAEVRGRVADGRPARSSARAPGAGAALAPVGLSVGKDAMTLTPDTKVLSGAKTTYPVYIDPTPVWTPKSYNKTGWASVAETYPSSNYWNDTPDPQGNMQVGNSGVVWSHTLMNFALPTLAAGSTVNKATLRLREVWSWSCTASTVNVYAPTAYTLSSSNATWNYWNGKQGSVIDGQPEAHGYNSSCPAADVEFDVKSVVTSRLGKTQTFLLMGTNEANDHNSWKEFSPSTATLNLEYNQPPNVPSTLSTSPVTGCTTLTTVGDANINLKAVVSDPDGNTVGAGFELWKSSAPGSILYSTPPATFDFGSGQTAVALVNKSVLETAAAGAVTKFSWHVRTYDGRAYSSYSSTCDFNFDPTRAGAPDVTVAATATVNSPIQVTVTPPPTGTAPASYMYQLNAGAPITVPATSGNASFTVTPTRFTNTITVTGVTAGGNIGDSASQTFTAQAASPEAVDDLTMDGKADLLTVGRADLPPGLWLASGYDDPASGTDSRINRLAQNIGVNGNGTFGTDSAHDFDATTVSTGTFTGGSQNDVMAYYAPTVDRPGMAVILNGNGDGSTLHTTSGFVSTVSPGTFTDMHGQDPVRVVNAWNASGAGLAYPDLLAVNGSADFGRYYLSFYPNNNTVGGYPMGYDVTVNTPAGDQNWGNWALASTRLAGGTALFLHNTSTGALYLWTGVTVTTNPDYTATVSYTQYAVTTTGLAPADTIQASDIDADGDADLWGVAATGATTAYLTTALNSGAGTATLTAQTTAGLITSTHAWTLADIGSAADGAPITTAGDIVGAGATSAPLTAGGTGVVWHTGDVFSPNAQFGGAGYLHTSSSLTFVNADFTLSAWVKLNNSDGVVLSGDGTVKSEFKLYANGSDSSWRFAMADSDASTAAWHTAVAPPGSARLGVWTHLTVSYQKSTGMAILSIDGVNSASLQHPTTSTYAGGQLRIGVDWQTSGAFLNGQVADVQLYNTANITPSTTANCTSDPVIYGINANGALTFTMLEPATGTVVRKLTSTATIGYTPASIAVLNNNTLLVPSTSGTLYRIDILTNTDTLTFAAPVALGTGWTLLKAGFDGTYYYGITSGDVLRRYQVTTAKPVLADIINWSTVGTGFGLTTFTATAPNYVIGSRTSDGLVRNYQITSGTSWTSGSPGNWGMNVNSAFSPGGGLYYVRDNSNTVTLYRDAAPTVLDDNPIPHLTKPVGTSADWGQSMLSAQPGICG
ncbi:LamG-like jellyroll fold domain-containing protein [Catellatospora tritici]|uniref:LamG-like jellyroll fold domain-containing protein n=1 Tax=Catellatospora tritici TaxID=2851566 RepID=UPI001C2D72DF|nr:LamG-like jellyroll fold domain-containing protein [Catellatospora tritici]MBV1854485.1 hypothetical protein [Catellatospora tritici]